jgi:hypothetical protein
MPRPGGPNRGLATVAAEEHLTFTSFLEDAERHRREHVSEERRRYRGMVPADQAGPMTALGHPTLHHHHRAHRAPAPPARTSRTTPSFRLAFS